MRASDFVQTEAARNASAERLIQTETTDAVNSGLVGSADKSGMALKEGLYSVDRSRVALTDQNLRGKARVSYGITDGSSADMAGLNATERIDAKIKQQAQAAAGKRVRVKRLYGSVQDEEMGLVDVTDSLRDEVKEIYKRRRLKGGAAAVAGSAVHSTLQDSELEGADDLYYKGKGAVNLARRAKRRLSGKDALRSKKKLGKLSEKGYEKKKAAETAADIQRRAQTRRYMHRSVQASAKASAARKGGLTALASQGGGGGIIAALGGGGTVAFIIIGVLLAVVLLTSFIAFQQQQNDVGSLTGIEAEIASCLKGYGYTDEAVAAILGNMKAESGMNPALDADDGAGTISLGLMQLVGDERNRFLRWCANNGKAWDTVAAQMEWTFSGEAGTGTVASMWMACGTSTRHRNYSNNPGYESRFAEADSWTPDDFKVATDVDLATYAWMGHYEGPYAGYSTTFRNYPAHLDTRLEYAREYLAKLRSSAYTSTGNTIVDAAYSQLGVPYVWGGTTPYVGLDCSGLTQYCYAQAGISIPHYTGDQYNALTRVSLSDAQPGDILYKSGHVGIYIGNDQYIHAPHTGDVVKISSGIGYFTCALRAT